MKKISKLAAVLLALLMTLVMIPSAHAAEGTPGETVYVSFSFDNITGINNTTGFVWSDTSIFSNISYSVSTNLTDQSYGDAIYVYGTGVGSVTVTVAATISPSAPNGASSTVTFYYETGDADFNLVPGSDSRTITVNVPVTPPPSGDGGGNSGGSTTPTPPSGPTEPEVKIDYSELNKQIGEANALSAAGYTDASWATLSDALAKANAALSSKDQNAVDQAAKDLQAAIAALVKVDYTALQQAIEKTETLLSSDNLSGLVQDLLVALESGKGLLTSGDQGAVDAAAKSLEDLLLAIQEELDAMKIPEDDFCNVSIHQVWFVLFFVSLALNVAFVVLAVLYVVRRNKKNRKDTTPLVDYDIGDDL